MKRGTDPLPWLNDDLTLVTRSSTITDSGNESYLKLLRPETLRNLEAWRKKNNGNYSTEKTV
jgi:hypothetical protein